MNFQIVEEIPRIDLKEVVKILEKLQIPFKGKRAFQWLAHFVLNVFPALQSSKLKWWSVLTCYYKPHSYFGKVWLWKNQMPYFNKKQVFLQTVNLNQVTIGNLIQMT